MYLSKKAVMNGQRNRVTTEAVAHCAVAMSTYCAMVGSASPTAADYAEEMHKVIKGCLLEIFGDAGADIPVLYGGSVNPGNANELIVQPSIDGLFTGRAAWQADKFDRLIRDAKKTFEDAYGK